VNQAIAFSNAGSPLCYKESEKRMKVISERNLQIVPLQGDSCVPVRPRVIENRAIKTIVFVEEIGKGQTTKHITQQI